MKQILKHITLWRTWLMIPIVSFSLQSCSEEEKTNRVDLRYRVEDTYELEAKNPALITLLVKSTKPWEVFGTKDWHVISPDKGEAGDKQTVTITCTNNEDLDDRIDTIFVKSDYWVGKQFTILQKGTAYLDLCDIDFTIPKQGGEGVFQVLSNQKWTARVIDGTNWLSVVVGESGELNGEVKVSAKENNGEQRVGLVEICDRHGVAKCMAECIQAGVVLNLETPKNGKWFALEANTQQLEVAVEANTEWVAEKSEPNDEWFQIVSVASNKITLSMMENVGQAVRQGIVLLKTKAVEGTEVITKELKFKQINKLYTITNQLDKTYSTGAHSIASNLLPGKYIFYFKGDIDAKVDVICSLTWKWGSAAADICKVESRIRPGGYAQGFTSPWNNHYNYANPTSGTKLDLSKSHSLGFQVEENSEVSPSMTNCCWFVDGVEVANIKKKGGIFNPNIMFWERVFVPSGELSINVAAGAVALEKYECTPVLNWGE